MNFLGHCYLCGEHKHLITGNLGGDFYKGNLSNFTNLPLHIQQGIKLHRFIDDYTDQSPDIGFIAHLLQSKGINKVSFIATDILCDHYLAKNWNHYSLVPYTIFVEEIYLETARNLAYITPEFEFLFNKLKEYGWLNQYPSHAGITQVLDQYSHRLKFDNHLKHASGIYLNFEETIDLHFKSFLTSIQTAVAEFIVEHKLANL